MELYSKSQTRIIESLIAASLLILSFLLMNVFLFIENVEIKNVGELKEIAEGTLTFLLYNDILTKSYEKKYNVIVNFLEKIIPKNYGYKISIYNESWKEIWSYKRSNFNINNSESAFIILNGYKGSKYTYFLIIVLTVSK